MTRAPRALQTRALVRLVVIVSLLTSACAAGPTLHPAVGVQLAFAWEWVAPSPSYVGMPAADDRAVAATFGHHGVVLLTPAGAVLWQVTHDRLRDVAPALGIDIVVAAAEGGVVAFDRTTGAERWVASLGNERPTAPVLTPDLVVVLTWEGHAVAFGRADGRERWRAALPGGAMATPVVDASTLVAMWQPVSHDGAAGVVGLDLRTGATKWAQPIEPGGVGGPALAGDGGRGLVVLVGGDLRAHAFDIADGTVRWVADTAGGAGSPEVPPVAEGSDVIVADRLTGLTRLAATDGTRRWAVAGPGVVERGGPVALPSGRVALPIDAGGLLVTAGGHTPRLYSSDGRVSGLARTRDLLVVATREGDRNAISAFRTR
jgi:outer membrane protein assembly factor BamB